MLGAREGSTPRVRALGPLRPPPPPPPPPPPRAAAAILGEGRRPAEVCARDASGGLRPLGPDADEEEEERAAADAASAAEPERGRESGRARRVAPGPAAHHRRSAEPAPATGRGRSPPASRRGLGSRAAPPPRPGATRAGPPPTFSSGLRSRPGRHPRVPPSVERRPRPGPQVRPLATPPPPPPPGSEGGLKKNPDYRRLYVLMAGPARTSVAPLARAAAGRGPCVAPSSGRGREAGKAGVGDGPPGPPRGATPAREGQRGGGPTATDGEA